MRRPKTQGFAKFGSVAAIAAAVTFIGACTPASDMKAPVNGQAPAAASSPATSPAVSPAVSPSAEPSNASASKAESLVGRWPGVEGTYLNITKKDDKYSVEIANLDGPKTYEGTATAEGIEFTRNGKKEMIKTASGPETGMKGFEKETNCVVVTKGSEGFCRK